MACVVVAGCQQRGVEGGDSPQGCANSVACNIFPGGSDPDVWNRASLPVGMHRAIPQASEKYLDWSVTCQARGLILTEELEPGPGDIPFSFPITSM